MLRTKLQYVEEEDEDLVQYGNEKSFVDVSQELKQSNRVYTSDRYSKNKQKEYQNYGSYSRNKEKVAQNYEIKKGDKVKEIMSFLQEVESNPSVSQSFRTLKESSQDLEVQQNLKQKEKKVIEETEIKFAYSEAKAKIVELQLELSDSNKSIESLQAQVAQLKEYLRKQEDQQHLELAKKNEIFNKQLEEASEKQIAFIEELLKEKEQRNKHISDLNAKLRESESKYEKKIADMQNFQQKEIKKIKDSIMVQEKMKKEQ